MALVSYTLYEFLVILSITVNRSSNILFKHIRTSINTLFKQKNVVFSNGTDTIRKAELIVSRMFLVFLCASFSIIENLILEYRCTSNIVRLAIYLDVHLVK